MYDIEILSEAQKDFSKLDRSVQILIIKQFEALQKNPYKGDLLRNSLAGLRKLYVDKKKFRIVYRVQEEKIIVEIIAIGKRDKSEIYKNTQERI